MFLGSSRVDGELKFVESWLWKGNSRLYIKIFREIYEGVVALRKEKRLLKWQASYVSEEKEKHLAGHGHSSGGAAVLPCDSLSWLVTQSRRSVLKEINLPARWGDQWFVGRDCEKTGQSVRGAGRIDESIFNGLNGSALL